MAGLQAIQAIRTKDGALDETVAQAGATSEPEPEPDAEEPEPEQTLADWLGSVGFAEHEETIAAYLSVSSQLQDLSVMADDDMAELVDDMELGEEGCEDEMRFRAAVTELREAREQAAAVAKAAKEAAAEAAKVKPEDTAWSELVAALKLESADDGA
eukprot:COSAG04_NODE_2711_length_3697_cov_5.529739_6_plen_157_part_00